MTTKEKQRRKDAAKRHRNETPTVIVPPTNESNDLMEAANMKLRPQNENNEIVEAVNDQVAEDATINTEAADDFIEEVTRDDVPLVGEEPSMTNKERALASIRTAFGEEVISDPTEIWFREKTLAAKQWLKNAAVKANEALLAGWLKLDSQLHKMADSILSWSYKTNNAFRNQCDKWFPVKATRDELAEAMNYMAQYVNTGLEEVKQMVASKTVVDRGRIDSLLFAVQSNQKVRATKLYASLTGADLATAKEAIEAIK